MRSISWVLVKYVNSRPHPRPTGSESQGEEPGKLYVQQLLSEVPPSSVVPSFYDADLYTSGQKSE